MVTTLADLSEVLDRVSAVEAEIRERVLLLEELKKQRTAAILEVSKEYPRTTVAALLGVTPGRVSQIVGANWRPS